MAGSTSGKSVIDQFKALNKVPPFLKMMWDSHPGMALLNVVLRLIKAVIPLAMLYVGKLIIDEVVRLNGVDGDLEYDLLITYVVIEFVLAIFSDFLNRGIALIDSLLGDLFANASSVRIMRHAASMDLDQFENADFYDKLERARRQTLGRTVLMSQVLSQVQDIITMVSLAVGLVIFNPLLIVLLVIAVIPSFLGENYFNEQSYSLVHSWTPERRELDYLRYTGASDITAKEVKVFGLSEFLINRFSYLSDKFYSLNKVISRKRAYWGAVFSSLGTIAYYGTYAYIIWQTVNGILSLGDLTFLAGSFLRFRTLLEGALNRFSKITEGALYLQDFFDFFAIKSKMEKKSGMKPVPRPLKEGIVFEEVSFKYDNTPLYAVQDLSFHLKAGEKLALVGENGAGKTTLVKLLARLYDPSEGRILLDGVDLREYDPEDLNRNIGVIFQDFVKFQLTAGLNIAVGQIEEKENFSTVKNAAIKSLADQVIDTLPNQYEQMIGRRFAEGVDLSGGQWQKIALARAYMRDAQILILDEPTAALDARAEHEVFQRFADLTKEKTAVLISHRFSTVRMADRILVLDKGKLAELGSHEELVSLNGIYANLFNLQARGYL